MPLESTPFWFAFVVGAAGAAAAELLKLYEYAGKLPSAKYRLIARSPLFWSVVAGMVASAGFITWAVNHGPPPASPLQLVATGIGCRSIVRELASAKFARNQLKLGKDEQLTLRDVFS